MSLTQAFNNAVTGLRVNSRSTEVVSSNLANAMTEGYGLRRLDRQALDNGGFGGGVQAIGITRHVNPQIVGSRRLADAELGYSQTHQSAAAGIERLIGAPGETGSLSDRFAKFKAAMVAATADPSSASGLAATRESLSELVTGITTAAHGIQDQRLQIEKEIAHEVERLNGALEQVDRLNSEITKTLQRGSDTSGLVDQRQQVIDAISENVPIQQFSRPGGQIALVSTMGEMLVDDFPRKIEFNPVKVIDATMTLAGGALGTLTINDREMPVSRPVGGLVGGRLEALFHTRDTVLPGAQGELDAITADLVGRLSDVAVDPSVAIAGGGLIDAHGPIDLLNPVGLSARIKLHDNLSDPTRLRDGIGAVAPGPVGNTAILSGWIDSLNTTTSLFVGGPSRTLGGHFSEMSADVSARQLSAAQNQTYATSRHAAVREEELSMGVDTDTELQILMQLEKAYAANARVVQSADQMLQSLLEI